MRFGVFSKTFTVKCPDGRPAIVFKSLDDALPLALRASGGRAGARGAVTGTGSGEIAAEYRSDIDRITFAIDSRNSSQIMDFRNAYLAFMSDPCGQRDLLDRITHKIMQDRAIIERAKIQLDALLALLNHGAVTMDQVAGQMAELARSLSVSLETTAVARIRHARADAKEMLGSSE